MALSGRFGDSDVMLEAGAADLRALSHAIRRAAATRTIALTTRPEPLTPHLGHAKSIKIERNEDRVCISREGEEIVIRGSQEALGTLARNLEFLAGQSEDGASGCLRPHLHIEYHPGHGYLSEISMPLIVTRMPP